MTDFTPEEAIDAIVQWTDRLHDVLANIDDLPDWLLKISPNAGMEGVAALGRSFNVLALEYLTVIENLLPAGTSRSASIVQSLCDRGASIDQQPTNETNGMGNQSDISPSKSPTPVPNQAQELNLAMAPHLTGEVSSDLESWVSYLKIIRRWTLSPNRLGILLSSERGMEETRS
ncbi:hypothetical protein FRB90_004268, partial [Tulasnella sp. 427]